MPPITIPDNLPLNSPSSTTTWKSGDIALFKYPNSSPLNPAMLSIVHAPNEVENTNFKFQFYSFEGSRLTDKYRIPFKVTLTSEDIAPYFSSINCVWYGPYVLVNGHLCPKGDTTYSPPTPLSDATPLVDALIPLLADRLCDEVIDRLDLSAEIESAITDADDLIRDAAREEAVEVARDVAQDELRDLDIDDSIRDYLSNEDYCTLSDLQSEMRSPCADWTSAGRDFIDAVLTDHPDLIPDPTDVDWPNIINAQAPAICATLLENWNIGQSVFYKLRHRFDDGETARLRSELAQLKLTLAQPQPQESPAT